MTLAQTVARAGETAETNEAVEASYSRHTAHASAESIVTAKLGWAIRTLHNPKIRRGERECLLLLAGEILLGFLAQDHLENGA